ncbi:hypothetical protein [Rosistilla oblonga]|uniref:Uncharacterized protein n=1 Tax=Rosistilla oblonga TaxID=2527990 RepID=A0A518IQI4_9BACT|nr:hypothetical protein [Rosistilla oblonga]QDV55344.1 hypothetical protein Mal33_13150 [Rosistilla oblonga]
MNKKNNKASPMTRLIAIVAKQIVLNLSKQIPVDAASEHLAPVQRKKEEDTD